MSLLVANGRCVDPASRREAQLDLRIDDGLIAEVGAGLPRAGHEVVDASGLWVLPGLVDLRAHLRDPGEEYKEDVASAGRAAVAGGVTALLAMPDTKPVVDNAELVHFVRQRGEAAGLARVYVAGAITQGLAGERLAVMGEMRRAGAVAVCDGDRWVKDAALMRRALEYARDFNLPVFTHAEEPTLSRGALMHESAVSTRLGLKGQPRVAEDVAVARDVMLAEYTGGRLHVAHVSSRGAVEIIRAAKHRGVAVTADVAAHHLRLTDEVVSGYGTSLRVVPPVREETDRQALIAGLADGALDAIVSDHSPQSILEKDTPFDEAQVGAIGLQTLLPLALELWRNGELPLGLLVERLTLGPARVIGAPLGTLAKGAPADLVVVDPDARYRLTRETLRSKCANSPFLDHDVRGRAEITIVGGRVVYRRAP